MGQNIHDGTRNAAQLLGHLVELVRPHYAVRAGIHKENLQKYCNFDSNILREILDGHLDIGWVVTLEDDRTTPRRLVLAEQNLRHYKRLR